MPKEAMTLGAARKELPLQRMADVIARFSATSKVQSPTAALAA